MGNSGSSLSPAEQQELVHAAHFTEQDIKKLYKRFRALDTNQNGELDPHELFDVPDIADVSQMKGKPLTLLFRILSLSELLIFLTPTRMVKFRSLNSWLA
eukprot:GHVN01102242.1.p1 GENE.GHVN01102242.1~~GHVN01102242.1.p1  ORF type:complete len:100 (+),score=4.29 GHVN01102242.1:436-735(+)